MIRYQANTALGKPPEGDAAAVEALAPVQNGQAAGVVPPGIILTERAVVAIRDYLAEHRLDGYRVFYAHDLDLYDIDDHLAKLGEQASWETVTPAGVGELVSLLTHDSSGAKAWSAGLLRLDKHEIVLARWYWLDEQGNLRAAWLCAAPTADHYFKLREQILALRHEGGAAVWQVVRGDAGYDGERIPRDPKAGEDMILDAAVRDRIETEVIRFFGDDVSALYRSLNVPHRRGVLLHGPPGNGKTSLIRMIGAALPQVPALVLRPSAGFDTDDLESVIDRWTGQAPAVLVIEDLNWLLESVNVSTFLNLLDGIESKVTGGLLLIATTNYPEKLDPAINNRPGRFDVVVELPCPNREARAQFLARKLPDIEAGVLERIAAEAEGVSFAHLEEILRLSGLLAIQAGRGGRTTDDVLRAAEIVRSGFEEAQRGFPSKSETPFGLAAQGQGRRRGK